MTTPMTMGFEAMSFEECMAAYAELPLGPPDDDEMNNAIGYFKGYLWQEAERRVGVDLDEFPLVVDALTCAAVYERDLSEALLYTFNNVPDDESDSLVYHPRVLRGLVRTAELLPEYVEITPPEAALAVRIPNEAMMEEVIEYDKSEPFMVYEPLVSDDDTLTDPDDPVTVDTITTTVLDRYRFDPEAAVTTVVGPLDTPLSVVVADAVQSGMEATRYELIQAFTNGPEG